MPVRSVLRNEVLTRNDAISRSVSLSLSPSQVAAERLGLTRQTRNSWSARRASRGCPLRLAWLPENIAPLAFPRNYRNIFQRAARRRAHLLPELTVK